MSKTAIITGINGQLGQYMAKYLLDNHPDIRVVGTQRHKSYDAQPLLFPRDKVTIDLMDLSDAHSIESLIVKYKPEFFVNTAANAFVGESWAVPAQHFEINALAVLHQLEAIRKHSPHTRYFNMGTSEEFGATEKSFLNESSPASPRSPYGASKVAARQIVKVWRESYGLYAIQGWTFNFESEIRGEKYVTRKVTKGVARIAKAIVEGNSFEPIELGNVDSHRSWQHAEDVARGIWTMLNQDYYNLDMIPAAAKAAEEADGCPKGFEEQRRAFYASRAKDYVLSAPDVHTVRELVEKAFYAAGIQGKWEGQGLDERYLFTYGSVSFGDMSVLTEPLLFRRGPLDTLVRINPAFFRPADVTYLHGDASAIQRDLGWSPKVTFDELVTRMVRNDLAALDDSR